jgi:hypothetical protein
MASYIFLSAQEIMVLFAASASVATTGNYLWGVVIGGFSGPPLARAHFSPLALDSANFTV